MLTPIDPDVSISTIQSRAVGRRGGVHVSEGILQISELRSDRAADLPWLDSAALRQELAAGGARCVRAPHPAGLLAQARADLLAGLDPGFTFSDETGLLSFPVQLGKALQRAGLSSCKTREALIAEVQYLALVLGRLVEDFSPRVHLALVDAGQPVPQPYPPSPSASVALVYLFAPPAGRSRPAAAGPEDHPGDVTICLAPGMAAVVEL